VGLACLVCAEAAESRASDGRYVATDWVRRHKGPAFSAGAKAVAVDAQGNVYVNGSAESDTSIDFLTIKYGPDGRQLWAKRYHSPEINENYAIGLAVDGQGNVWVTGYSINNNPHWEVSSFITIKYDGDGQLLWERFYDVPVSHGANYPAALVVDAQGNAYVTGSSFGDFSTGRDFATIKYSPDGEELWIRRYNGPGNGDDDASSIILDGQGNVYVTGTDVDVVGNSAIHSSATIKYSSDGKELWVRRYKRPSDQGSYSGALAVDGQGNVIVSVSSYSSGTGFDYTTIKYSPEGQRRWVRRYNSGSWWDLAGLIAVDALGNVYITGLSTGSGTHDDFTTIKYNPEGKQLWVRRYNGPGNDVDRPRALALDGQGNAYVTGYSVGLNTSSDYATIKYSPDGRRLWVRRYNGPGNSSDSPRGLAVDGQGNVYVTGYSGTAGSFSDYDFLTIKYTQTP
jgi:sugar lactone lactonase YvrE